MRVRSLIAHLNNLQLLDVHGIEPGKSRFSAGELITMRHSLSTWFEWVKRSAEDTEVAKRAAARKRLIEAIANEN